MQETINWILSNKLQLIELVLALIGAASIIVKLTPTTKDDKVLGKIKGFISRFIALNPRK